VLLSARNHNAQVAVAALPHGTSHTMMPMHVLFRFHAVITSHAH
jgi:hypothetical protein